MLCDLQVSGKWLTDESAMSRFGIVKVYQYEDGIFILIHPETDIHALARGIALPHRYYGLPPLPPTSSNRRSSKNNSKLDLGSTKNGCAAFDLPPEGPKKERWANSWRSAHLDSSNLASKIEFEVTNAPSEAANVIKLISRRTVVELISRQNVVKLISRQNVVELISRQNGRNSETQFCKIKFATE